MQIMNTQLNLLKAASFSDAKHSSEEYNKSSERYEDTDKECQKLLNKLRIKSKAIGGTLRILDRGIVITRYGLYSKPIVVLSYID